jgi:nicotinamidase/pyrazinamidase
MAGSHGAALDERLDCSQIERIVDKGVDRETDGYSGFTATDLALDLRGHGVRRVFVCGLATDYCVKATALDAKATGFDAVVLRDASAAVNVRPNDEESALEELRRAGVRIADSGELLLQ